MPEPLRQRRDSPVSLEVYIVCVVAKGSSRTAPMPPGYALIVLCATVLDAVLHHTSLSYKTSVVLSTRSPYAKRPRFPPPPLLSRPPLPI